MESSFHNSIQLSSNGGRNRNLSSRIGAGGARTTEVLVNVEQDVQLDQLKGVAHFNTTGSGDEVSGYTNSPSIDDKSNFA